MFIKDGIARLTDFNIARIMGSVSRGISIAGTPGYMAPEQLIGEASDRSDVFSLALTLSEALIGRNPVREYGYAVVNVQEYVYMVMKAKDEIVKSLNKLEIPSIVKSKLVELISKCLDPSPNNRPTMKEFRDRLIDIIQIFKYKI